MCVMCDAVAFRLAKSTPVAAETIDYYTSIEHYFPKSIYPHLAIHPFNLIPICSAVNRGLELLGKSLDMFKDGVVLEDKREEPRRDYSTMTSEELRAERERLLQRDN